MLSLSTVTVIRDQAVVWKLMVLLLMTRQVTSSPTPRQAAYVIHLIASRHVALLSSSLITGRVSTGQ